MGQKFLLGKANKSTISGLLPVVLGVLTVTKIFESESNSKSAHEQCEKGSNEFWCCVSSSFAQKDPKYPKQRQAHITFLLCFFQCLLFRSLLISTRISKTRGSVYLTLFLFSDLSIPQTRILAEFFAVFWFFKPKSLEIVWKAER